MLWLDIWDAYFLKCFDFGAPFYGILWMLTVNKALEKLWCYDQAVIWWDFRAGFRLLSIFSSA